MKNLIILFFGLVTALFGQIGEVTALNGEAFLTRQGSQSPLALHAKIEEKDTIKTMAGAKLQIIFKDETVISLGQKTTFSVEAYLYDKTDVKAKFNVSNGLFKSITGKIGKIAPQNFSLKTQNATIGVRGTTIIGETSKTSDTIICSSGKIVVTGANGAMTVDMGESTIVRRDQKPTQAVKIPEISIQKLDQQVTAVEVPKPPQNPVATVKTKTQILTPVVQAEVVAEVKDQWGAWNKEKIIDQVVVAPITKVENETPPQTVEGPSDPAKTEPPPQISQDDPALADLRARAGMNNPTYQGTVSGFIDTRDCQMHNGEIKLAVDLGKGKVDGDIGFDVGEKRWNAALENGTVDKNGQLDFGLGGTNLTGGGNGNLSGQTLENANGGFQLQNSETNQNAFGTFNAVKK